MGQGCSGLFDKLTRSLAQVHPESQAECHLVAMSVMDVVIALSGSQRFDSVSHFFRPLGGPL